LLFERWRTKRQAIAAIALVKTVQMVRLQRVILVVGTLSIFEAALQRWPDCKNGFKQASETLEQKSKIAHKDMRADPHELSTCSRMINVVDITNW
jgi:hypothetical protein